MLNPTEDGSWNGAYRLYAIYVTDDAGGNPDNWGAPVASGEWTWPNLQERRDVYFTAKAGRYVYFRRITAYGWYTEQGYPGFAIANGSMRAARICSRPRAGKLKHLRGE